MWDKPENAISNQGEKLQVVKSLINKDWFMHKIGYLRKSKIENYCDYTFSNFIYIYTL